jgi:hypothetical protein
MSASAQIIWLFAIAEPADPLTIPPLPLSIETRQRPDPAAIAAMAQFAGGQVRAHSRESSEAISGGSR